MEINKNKRNAIGQLHGYWNEDCYKCHFLYDNYHGYYEANDYSNLKIKSHLIYGQEIGCELANTCQYFYNKPDKRFGEQIKWE